ncbi:IS5 family transposase [Micromonospora sp. WMMA1363]|uniref:IS5 family transposase n=1 Tax=Micromonospora sp. WMMA1363 TaxID=3053985 RepID=UPI00259C755F|nr:IS5 family transposase [Micromonospora sp. WMMA1363]MDM4718623.1 IS5 family transposase [Micromonospora sp. WMMA1363]
MAGRSSIPAATSWTRSATSAAPAASGTRTGRLPAPQAGLPLLQDLDCRRTLHRMHNSLREQVRVQVEDRGRQPTAALVDSQSVRGAETVGRVSRGYDAGKRVNGRKRHIAVDTCGLLLAVLITGANVQDRDGARPLLRALHACFPGIRLVWADTGYTGTLVDWAATRLALTVRIVAKLAGQTTFVVLHRRWCVERTFSWINRCRRTVRDDERLPAHHAAMVQWAMIIVMTRRLARHQHT